MRVYHDFFWYPDPDQRFLKRIRIRANDTDPKHCYKQLLPQPPNNPGDVTYKQQQTPCELLYLHIKVLCRYDQGAGGQYVLTSKTTFYGAPECSPSIGVRGDSARGSFSFPPAPLILVCKDYSL